MHRSRIVALPLGNRILHGHIHVFMFIALASHSPHGLCWVMSPRWGFCSHLRSSYGEIITPLGLLVCERVAP